MEELKPPRGAEEAETTRDEDTEHLRLLTIFHYVVAAIAAAFACLPILHFLMGMAMVVGGLAADGAEALMSLVGCFLVFMCGSFILAGWAFAVCLALAGRYLEQRRRYNFCLVMAAVACMFSPFGTVLGVFTIIVLSRPSVKELFGQGGAKQLAAGP